MKGGWSDKEKKEEKEVIEREKGKMDAFEKLKENLGKCYNFNK